VRLAKRTLETPWETVRSGIFVAVATWAARRAAGDGRSERSWRPDLLMPICSLDDVAVIEPLALTIAGRRGSVRLIAVGDEPALIQATIELSSRLRQKGVHTTSTSVSATGFETALPTILDAMQADLFPPNLLVLDMTSVSQELAQSTRAHCQRLGCGLALFIPGRTAPLGEQRKIRVWLSDRSPKWTPKMHDTNVDLPVLVGWLAVSAWEGDLSLATAVRDGGDREAASEFLREVVGACRLPAATRIEVSQDISFLSVVASHPTADLSILGMPTTIDVERLTAIADAGEGAALFLMDAGRASAFA
jgi:solute carrier family 12 (sodium/potassium/chloride transporter), member 2